MKRAIITILSCFFLAAPFALAKKRNLKDCHADTTSNDCINDCFKNLRTAARFRSQGANTAREFEGWEWELNKPEMCETYGAGYIAFEYQHSFKESHIAEALVGNSTISFAGSEIMDRQPNELLADYFGLAPSFRGKIGLNPRMENYIVDFGLYVGLDYYLQGLYLRFHAPFVHARWTIDTNCGNCVSIESGSTDPNKQRKQFQPCYMGTDAVDTAATIKQALSGNFLFGDMNEPWCGGKFDFSRRTRNGLADIDVILGYNIVNDDCYHFSFFGLSVLPTGKKRKNLFIFDPVVGNQKHFEFGGGISAHTVLWSGEDSNLALFLEANVTHLFRSRQCRTFDLKDNGPFSRYMLLKEFDTDGTTFTYNNNLISANCFTTREVDVSVAVKGDASLALAYRWCGFGVDLGYNIYGHSREEIELRCNACPSVIDRRKFAIKGTEGVCCSSFPIALIPDEDDDLIPTIFPDGTPFPNNAQAPNGCEELESISQVTKQPSNATQADATAFKPGTMQDGMVLDSDCTVCLNSGIITEPTPVADLTPDDGFFVDNGLQPKILSANDLNILSGEAHSAITHKFFGFFSYTWMDECGWNPQLGIGFEAEFDGNHQRSGCERTGLNQWGALIKGSLSF